MFTVMRGSAESFFGTTTIGWHQSYFSPTETRSMTPFFIIESSCFCTESRQWKGMVQAWKHLRGTAVLSSSICTGGPAMGSRCSSWKTSDHSDIIASLTSDTDGSQTSSAGGTTTSTDSACVVAWIVRLGQPWGNRPRLIQDGLLRRGTLNRSNTWRTDCHDFLPGFRTTEHVPSDSRRSPFAAQIVCRSSVRFWLSWGEMRAASVCEIASTSAPVSGSQAKVVVVALPGLDTLILTSDARGVPGPTPPLLA